ncbi:MAG: hypothetical protein IJ998_08885 [Alistipes sp.]|nr:hypothetical protein [Alistipes sp.]
MANNNVKTQLERAIDMRERIFNFSTMVESTGVNLIQDLEYWVKMGFPEDIAQHYYHRYLKDDIEKMNQIVIEMKNRHSKFVDEIIEKFKQTVED